MAAIAVIMHLAGQGMVAPRLSPNLIAKTRCSPVSIPEERKFNGKPFPLTLSPDTSSVALNDWVKDNRDEILELVEEYDAVLLRGFAGSRTAMDFSEFAAALRLGDFGMGCSAAPRTNVAPGVFTANEAPPQEPIPFHHEMAQCDEQPSFVLFFCEIAASEGGATPIIPSHAVVEHLEKASPDVAERLRTLGVRYVRTLPKDDDPSSPIGKSWQKSFEAETREEAEAVMDEAGTSYTWFPNGDVRTVSKAMPALVRHDGTGREMFFNSVVAALQGWVDVRNDPRKAIVYGDGSDLDDEARAALDDVAEYMRENRVAFQWQAGDVLLIDNYKALHSRETFVPPRRVLASLWDDALPEPRNGLRVIRDVLPLPLRNRASNLGSFLRRVQKKGAGAAMRLRGGGSTAAAVGPGVAHSGARALRLRTGAMMPAVGLGVWKIPKDVCAEAVVSAIRQGYRHIDSACDYGNEVEVGEGIRRAIAEGIVTRDELWVTSKLWNTYHAKEHVEPACRRTLSDLGLDYVDLYLVHFPIALKYVPFETRYPPEWIYDPSCAEPKMELVHVPIQETWSAMEGLVSQGLAKNIGVCNFNVAGVRDLLSYATVPPAVLQVELHPYNQQPNLVRYCAEQDITVTGFSPLGSSSYVELGMATPTDSALTDPTIVSLADAKGVSPAQLILKWGLQRGLSIIPKSTKPERLAQNLDLEGVELSDDDMKTMAALDKGRRFNDPGDFCQGMGAFVPIYD